MTRDNEWQKGYKSVLHLTPAALIVFTELREAERQGLVSRGEVWAALAAGEAAVGEMLQEISESKKPEMHAFTENFGTVRLVRD